MRIALWLLLLAALLGAIYLNRVGLPKFLKERLVAELHARGVDIEFTRMRLHWYRGFIAENVRVVTPAETNAPNISATEAELLLSGRALLQRKVQVSGVSVRGGRMTLPVWGTNSSPRELQLERVSGELRFAPPDHWQLVGFRGQAFGVKLLFDGALTNGSALKTLSAANRHKPRDPSAATFWYDLVSRLQQSDFAEPSEIIATVYGDAREPSTFQIGLNVTSPQVRSPWGRGRSVTMSAQVAPATNGAFVVDLKLKAAQVTTDWANASSLNMEAHIAPSFTRWSPTNAHLTATLKGARTRWGEAGVVSVVADFTPNPSDAASSLARYTMRAQRVDTPWAKCARLELNSDGVLTSSNLWPSITRARLQVNGMESVWARAAAATIEGSLDLPAFEAMRFHDTNMLWRSRLDLVRAGLTVRADNVHSLAAATNFLPAVSRAGLDVSAVAFTADWRAPALTFRDVRVQMYDGVVTGDASLFTDTRRLATTLHSGINLRRLLAAADTNSLPWLAQFATDTAPTINASAQVTLLPPAAPRAASRPKWLDAVLPTLTANGDLAVGPARIYGVPVQSARTSFTLSNQAWHLPDLVLVRPEGQAVISHRGDLQSNELRFDIKSTVDPTCLAVLLDRNGRELVDAFVFTNTPHVRIQLTAHPHHPEQLSFLAELGATNLSYRGLPVREARSVLTLTNQVLSFLRPVVVRTEGTGRADAVHVNLKKQTILIDNATGMLDPWAVTHAVGPEVEKTIRPYHFVTAPAARVHGLIDCDDIRRTDLHFDVAGGPFEWMWFRFQQITGHVHWAGAVLTLSNVVGSLNGGRLEGSARFDFPERAPAKFQFRTLFNDINLHSLIADLNNPTNKVQGTLNGLLVITNANTEDMKSWFGYGNLAVNDGLLWDFPALGIFSPVLNTIKQGAGNSRAKEAVATFTITNSIIYSSDLTIHASGMRLKYDGSVDFDTRINGRMIAQLFRDTPGVGGIVATVLWPVTKLFEYKVSGTLSKPAAAPRVFYPFRFRDFGEEGRDDSKSTR